MWFSSSGASGAQKAPCCRREAAGFAVVLVCMFKCLPVCACFGETTHEFPEMLGTLGQHGQGLASFAQRSFEEKGITTQAGLRASLGKSEQNNVRHADFSHAFRAGPFFLDLNFSLRCPRINCLSCGSLVTRFTPAAT